MKQTPTTAADTNEQDERSPSALDAAWAFETVLLAGAAFVCAPVPWRVPVAALAIPAAALDVAAERTVRFAPLVRSRVAPGLGYPLCLLPVLLVRLGAPMLTAPYVLALAAAPTGLAMLLFFSAPVCRTTLPPLLACTVAAALCCAPPYAPLLAVTAAATAFVTPTLLLTAFPRSFSLAEALLCAQAVSVTMLARIAPAATQPTASPTIVLWHTLVAAVALAVACGIALSPRKKQKETVNANTKKNTRNCKTLGLATTVATTVSLGITAAIQLQYSFNPWTWTANFALETTPRRFLATSWICTVVGGYIFFPHTAAADTRRKFFHILASAAVFPGHLVEPEMTALALSLALVVFVLAETVRVAAIPPYGTALSRVLDAFTDARDEGTLLTSHFSLLLGLAYPVWISCALGRHDIGLCGIAALGIGDSLASLVGRAFGRHRWLATRPKTIEGSAAFGIGTALFLVLAFGITGMGSGIVQVYSLPFLWRISCASCFVALLEAFSSQIDNIFLPMALMLAIS